MAPPLLIAHPQNATIEELKQVSRVDSNETATRCTAIQMLLAGADRELVCNAQLAMYLPPYWSDLNPIERIGLTMKARGFNNPVCKNEEKLLERLHQAILDLIDNPAKTQQTTAIGTLYLQTL